MKLSRSRFNLLIASLVALAILCGLIAFYLDPIEKFEFVSDEITFSDQLRVIAKLKNNSLFEKDEIETDKIFVNITESCDALYTLNILCSKCKPSGNYEVRITLETKDWSKPLDYLSGNFVDYYSISIPVDVRKYLRTYEKISSELGYKASEPKVTILITTSAVNKTFERNLTLQLAEQIVKITFDEPKTNKFTEKSSVFIERFDVVILKYLYAVFSALLAIFAFIAYKKIEVIEEDKFKKYESIMVRAKSASKDKVELKSFEELLKLSEYLNKPIVRLNDGFMITDGSTIYFASKE